MKQGSRIFSHILINKLYYKKIEVYINQLIMFQSQTYHIKQLSAMFKKKKNNIKQTHPSSHQHPKRIPLLTIPSIQTTEEYRIKTMPNTEIKLLSKTLELKKQPSHSKKTISRKTTSRTAKLQNSLRPCHLRNLLKQVKEFKFNQISQISKSKSPVTSKSRSNKKYYTKTSSGGLKQKSNRKLSLKIDKTLDRLTFQQLFQDEESNLVYPSASDRPPERNNYCQINDQEEIDLTQMSQLRSSMIPAERFRVDIKSHDSLQQTVAAITIQRAWKSYRTKCLIQRYSKQCVGQIRRVLANPFPSQDLYGDNDEEDVQQVSNIQDSGQNGMAYEQIVKTIKRQQLQKWNNILELIETTKGRSPEEIARLFKQIQRQSQINRLELLSVTETRQENDKNKETIQVISPNKISRSEFPLSEERPKDFVESGKRLKKETESDSDGQYDSKKYIQYLDGDVFSDRQSSSSSRGIRLALGVTTISTKKQEMLLQSLNNRVAKLSERGLIGSFSLTNLATHPKEEPTPSRSRNSLKRSFSQKGIRRKLSNLSEPDHDDINLQFLAEEYLDYRSGENSSENIKLQQCQDKYSFSTLNKEQKDQTPLQNIDNYKSNGQDSLTFCEKEKIGDMTTMERQDGSLIKQQLYQQVKQNQNITKYQAVSSLIVNHLVLDLLKDIALSEILIKAIKNYQQTRPKVRRTEGLKKKKGFPTDKKEVELFLQNFINYLLKFQEKVLKNLQISTGPSALQMLKYMHSAEEDSVSANSEAEEANIMVIPNRVFDAFWKIKQKSIVVQVPASFTQQHSNFFRQNVQYLKSFNKIFFRALFDTFNQCLDSQRNFGVLGKPFPWKKVASFTHQISIQSMKDRLKNSQKKMIQLSTSYCGLIVDTEDMKGAVGGEQYLLQVQEDRLSRMLASDLLENELRWHFYDDQEAEILIEVSTAVYEEMLFELLQQLVNFQ